jgi:hypothetical protein
LAVAGGPGAGGAGQGHENGAGRGGMEKVMETGMVVDEVEWELKMLGWDINPSLLISSEDQV